jgi:hypothetical protein
MCATERTSGELAQRALAELALLERDPPDPGRVAQRLLELGIGIYGATYQEQGAGSALPAGADVTVTDVVATVSSLLEAADVELFELALWQNWGRG